MVIKREIAHKAKRALGKSDHWWDASSIELFSRPQDGAVTAQRDDVVDFAFILCSENGGEKLRQLVQLAKVSTCIDLVQ